MKRTTSDKLEAKFDKCLFVGYPAYVKQTISDKLEAKSDKCLFVGYPK